MDTEILKASLVILLSFGLLFFQKPINHFFNHFWREEKLREFLLNPITASVSSAYLLFFIFESGAWFFLLQYRLAFAAAFFAILAVPIYSFTDFYLRKLKNKRLKNQGIKGGAYLGAKLILLADIMFTAFSIYNLFTK